MRVCICMRVLIYMYMYEYVRKYVCAYVCTVNCMCACVCVGLLPESDKSKLDCIHTSNFYIMVLYRSSYRRMSSISKTDCRDVVNVDSVRSLQEPSE